MREINVSTIERAVKQLCLDACRILPQDVKTALQTAQENEENQLASFMLGQIIDNAQIAEENHWPTCQDTGMAVLFLDVGQDVHFVGGDITESIEAGVAAAYAEGYLRKSVTHPILRQNTHTNTPAVIYFNLVPGDQVLIRMAPKGFGSENMSRSYMLMPTAGEEGILAAIVETVQLAGGKPCPPIIVGVGIGGTIDKAAVLAKKALFRPLAEPSPDPLLADLEERALQLINGLGIGVQGVGGNTTALAVHMESFPTHIAGLPVVINLQCHAARHAEILI